MFYKDDITEADDLSGTPLIVDQYSPIICI